MTYSTLSLCRKEENWQRSFYVEVPSDDGEERRVQSLFDNVSHPSLAFQQDEIHIVFDARVGG